MKGFHVLMYPQDHFSGFKQESATEMSQTQPFFSYKLLQRNKKLFCSWQLIFHFLSYTRKIKPLLQSDGLPRPTFLFVLKVINEHTDYQK